MPTRRIVLVPLLLVALFGTACSNAESGTPSAQDPPTTGGSSGEPSPDTEPATSTGSAAPPVERPKPIDLTGVDVCRMLSALPLAEYGLDAGRPPLPGESDLFPGSKDCFVSGRQHNVSLLIVAVTSRDARSYADMANVATRTDGRAAGYPISVLTPRNPASCLGVVDVHDEQMLYISYALNSPIEEPVTPQPRLCRTVPVIAAAAVRALG